MSDLFSIASIAAGLACVLALAVNEFCAARGIPRRQGFTVSKDGPG